VKQIHEGQIVNSSTAMGRVIKVVIRPAEVGRGQTEEIYVDWMLGAYLPRKYPNWPS
jgi:hypothetical protein